MERPLILIPMGDPAGIGPEIVLRALAGPAAESARCLAVGDSRVLAAAMEYPNMPRLRLHPVEAPPEGLYTPGTVDVLDLHNIDPADFTPGRVSPLCGRAAYEYIERSIRIALSGHADAVTTAPINKESLRAAGVPYIGHTEIFGALTGAPDPLTMFETLGMRIFFLSRHVSLEEACRLVTRERVAECARRCLGALASLGVEDPSLAVAGLNPHCGEHGLFGDCEVREIAPAVADLRARGLNVSGPIGADSVFWQAREGRYSAVLSLYHDQGHIAAKTVDFHRTVSLTLGMPVLRTSVDHGTAFDIAGRGLASPVSLTAALQTAAKYAPSFRKRAG